MTTTPAMPVRDAATVLVIRDRMTAPKVLMGRRNTRSTFMPDVYVFPGGAVDAGDAAIPLVRPMPDPCRARLSPHPAPDALAAAAIRELWEETGLRLAASAPWPAPPSDWQGFAEGGARPDAGGLRYIFRAITPIGRPRRFDARFFMADAAHLLGDPDDLTPSAELGDLQWVPVDKAHELGLAPVTAVALMQVTRRLPDLGPPPEVPFFDGEDEGWTIATFHRWLAAQPV